MVVAHRLSTIRNADEIIVINHNGIQERGAMRNCFPEKGCMQNTIICSLRVDELKRNKGLKLGTAYGAREMNSQSLCNLLERKK